MGLLFAKTVSAFFADPARKIVNRRLQLEDYHFLDRVDLTFQSSSNGCQSEYPYLEDLSTFKQLLPVPSFLLKPLKRYRLPYGTSESSAVNFSGLRTVIYIHGSGSISEDNSILQQLLLQNNCDLIRISYHIDYKKEGIIFPSKAGEMLSFLKETEVKIAPAIHAELKIALSRLKDEYPDLFINKEVILIAHSLGGGLAANLIAESDTVTFSKFINLDGTLMNPAIQNGLQIDQLHLSQDRLFKKEWIDADTFKDPLQAIGHSTKRSIWIQITDSSHFTFTDFPDLLKPYKIFRNVVGGRESAARIRKYVIRFILEPDKLRIDPRDNMIIDRG